MTPRFSIARLLAFVVFCGIAFAALRSPSYLWANVLFTIALGSLVMAAIDLVSLRGRPRASAFGFLIAGGAYFAVSTLPVFHEALCERLVTEPALDMLYSATAPAPATVPPMRAGPMGMASMMGMGGMMGTGGGTGGMFGGMPVATVSAPQSRWEIWTEPDRSQGLGYQIGTVFLTNSEAYRRIGHSIATLFAAFLGSLYARRRFDLASSSGESPRS